jgi:hypothetical protein
MEAYRGSGGISLPFLTSPLDGGEWSALRPGRFTPAKEPRYPLDKRPSGRRSRPGRCAHDITSAEWLHRASYPPLPFPQRVPVITRRELWSGTVFINLQTVPWRAILQSSVWCRNSQNRKVLAHLAVFVPHLFVNVWMLIRYVFLNSAS